ncbi:DUF6119 family protein [Companilactobacillus bobalius]|uniref:TIGR04141 family sporadically distributed protein n=2 Tax=Companilactobacillus bobalius TaxID=2801451 RepID=A0A202F9L9_9LACO|nr:DUF6119 family protein [Companilactobacillus bobalius]KAE9558836.1 hypothetical protein ATN92_13040 [Companilactobacillus bobalius]KRK84126.1 hypothetical protein FC78_GL001135 [Companilactobacillus bobalius DSM 19674]OVE97181.1 hypothetical protein LKACC16343_01671 [Companilactobacillus bobalius]GEO58774.1 hypothetical protein LBO01_19030 [Companilactobacillus paralimentarius]
MVEDKKRKYDVSIRLHKKNVTKYENVLKDEYKKDGSEGDKIKIYSLSSKGMGHGKAFALLRQKSTPKWKGLFENMIGKRDEIPDNFYSKAVIVMKIMSKNGDNYFMSISFGYGDSLLNSDTIINDFGKNIAAKKISNRMIDSVSTMQITDAIVQSNKQIVGNSSEGINDLISGDSEFPSSVSGVFRNGAVETKIEGLGNLLKAKRMMKPNEIAEDLKYYLDAYLTDDKVSEWISRLSKVTNKNEIERLNYSMVQSIEKGEEFGIAYPYFVEVSDMDVSGLSKKIDSMDASLVEKLRLYINSRKHTAKTVLSRIKTISKVTVTVSENGEKRSERLFKCIFLELIELKKRYILFNGEWFEVSNTFYTDMKNVLDSVKRSNLCLPESRNNENETEYNSRATNKLGNACELHLTGYRNRYIGKGSVEPADIVTSDRKFLYVKFGKSSSTLSHLFMQSIVPAQLMSQNVDDKFREKIEKELIEKNSQIFKTGFLSKNIPNNKITIVFVIIRNKQELPFFSMISFSRTINELRSMGFKVELAWVKQK